MGKPGRPIVLLTDFGWKDHHVGVMKGVILSSHPDARIVDLSHDIISQDVVSAHILLQNAYPYFPRKTIFVAVVDPGVGTDRPIIGVEAGSHLFLAPDNGLLGFLGTEEPIRKIVQITKKKYFRDSVSNTFHGRDIFAPVAAHLSRGIPLQDMGPARKDLCRITIPRPTIAKDRIEGQVIAIDHFGNLVTNIPGKEIPRGRKLIVSVGKIRIRGISRTYASKREKATLALVGSDGMVEISVNRGNAAEKLAVSVGTGVRIHTQKI